jgi:hypothetical protein
MLSCLLTPRVHLGTPTAHCACSLSQYSVLRSMEGRSSQPVRLCHLPSHTCSAHITWRHSQRPVSPFPWFASSVSRQNYKTVHNAHDTMAYTVSHSTLTHPLCCVPVRSRARSNRTTRNTSNTLSTALQTHLASTSRSRTMKTAVVRSVAPRLNRRIQ